MTISIGGITLSDDLIWANEFDSASIGQATGVTLGGRTVIQTMPLDGGRTIVLEATAEGSAYKGYFTRSQVEQIKTLEAAGAAVSLVINSQTFDVVIQAGGVSVVPVMDYADPAADDHYTGTITMIEV